MSTAVNLFCRGVPENQTMLTQETRTASKLGGTVMESTTRIATLEVASTAVESTRREGAPTSSQIAAKTAIQDLANFSVLKHAELATHGNRRL